MRMRPGLPVVGATEAVVTGPEDHARITQILISHAMKSDEIVPQRPGSAVDSCQTSRKSDRSCHPRRSTEMVRAAPPN